MHVRLYEGDMTLYTSDESIVNMQILCEKVENIKPSKASILNWASRNQTPVAFEKDLPYIPKHSL